MKFTQGNILYKFDCLQNFGRDENALHCVSDVLKTKLLEVPLCGACIISRARGPKLKKYLNTCSILKRVDKAS